jgi:hypothetical protein
MQISIGMVEKSQGAFSSVGFVNWQILGIVQFQNEAKKKFNIVNICTNLMHSHLSMDILEMLISIYKKWPNFKMIWNAQSLGAGSKCSQAEFKNAKMTRLKIDIQTHEIKEHETNWHKT